MVCVQEEIKMTKLTHRILASLCIFPPVIFAYFFPELVRSHLLPFLALAIFVGFLCWFIFNILVPIKCVVKDCKGYAYMATDDEIYVKWLRPFFYKGHVCKTCGNVIPLSKGSSQNTFG